MPYFHNMPDSEQMPAKEQKIPIWTTYRIEQEFITAPDFKKEIEGCDSTPCYSK